MNKQDLYEFEKKIDKEVLKLELLNLPIRTVITSFYGGIDNLFFGHPLHKQKQTRPSAGAALASRLSYLLPFLLRCPFEPIGVSTVNALSPITVDRFEEAKFLTTYSHLCELMPEVRNGYYNVTKVDKVFYLTFVNDNFRESETRDRVLNELSLPFLIDKPIEDKSYFDRQVATLPTIDMGGLVGFVNENTRQYLNLTLELPIIPSEALDTILGVNLEQFHLFRACWMAIAQFHLEMAAAITKQLTPSNQKLMDEFFEWQVPYLSESFLGGLVLSNTGLTQSQYNSLMEIYCLDLSTNVSTAGDGFFPPFLRMQEGLLFHPKVVQMMVSSRNIPFALNKIRRTEFDTILSPALEPHLLSVVQKIFNKVSVESQLNVNWGQGEIDMLVYNEKENVAIQIQAKAAIPPQGSRLVRNVESQMKVGVDQLNKFDSLPQDVKDRIISRALGKTVTNVVTRKVLLGWSSFGTDDIWSLLHDIAPLNIALLYLLIKRQPDSLFHDIVKHSWDLIKEIVDETKPKWEIERLVFNDVTIEFPFLDYDEQTLFKHRIYLKEYSI